MRFALALVVPLLAALLQGSVAPFVAMGGARPNLVVLAAASWSVAAGPREAAWWAFWGGVVMDLLSGGPLGGFALASLVPVAAVGVRGAGGARSRSTVGGAVLVGVATLGAGVLYLLILALIGEPLGEAPPLAAAAVGGAVYNGVLALVTYPIARRACRAGEKQASFGW